MARPLPHAAAVTASAANIARTLRFISPRILWARPAGSRVTRRGARIMARRVARRASRIMEDMKPAGRGLVMLVLVAMGAAGLSAADRRPLGEIDFFGYKGLDLAAIRAALPFHEGDSFPPAKVHSDDLKRQVGEAVKRVIGREPTDVVIRLLRRQTELHGLYRVAGRVVSGDRLQSSTHGSCPVSKGRGEAASGDGRCLDEGGHERARHGG